MYLLDANVLIHAFQMHYRFQLCPGFWTAILRLGQRGHVGVPHCILAELTGKGDELSDWAGKLPSKMIVPDDLGAGPALSAWVFRRTPAYTSAARHVFLGGNDYRLISTAFQTNASIVTFEEPAPLGSRQVKIPDACIHLNVEYLKTPELMERHKVRWVEDPGMPNT